MEDSFEVYWKELCCKAYLETRNENWKNPNNPELSESTTQQLSTKEEYRQLFLEGLSVDEALIRMY